MLFLQGGASTAFADVPLNLSQEGDSVDHIVTGSWSKKAAQEAKKYCKVNIAAQGDNKHIPAHKDWKLQKQAKYVHYCDNETIQVRFAVLVMFLAVFRLLRHVCCLLLHRQLILSLLQAGSACCWWHSSFPPFTSQL